MMLGIVPFTVLLTCLALIACAIVVATWPPGQSATARQHAVVSEAGKAPEARPELK